MVQINKIRFEFQIFKIFIDTPREKLLKNISQRENKCLKITVLKK